MPLRCVDTENGIYLAWQFTPDEWESLKQRNQADRHLRMPCCGVGVVLRVSPLGTRYFAHIRRGECATAPETKEHLLTKQAVAMAAEQAGWSVQTERRGATPDGETWVADVYAECGASKVAFEIQWSTQTLEETSFRQERYLRSGVRCLWLMRNVPGKSSQALPMLPLSVEPPAYEPTVMVEARALQPELLRTNWQRISVSAFIRGALSKQFQFAPALGKQVPLVVHGRFRKCPGCGVWNRQISWLEIKVDDVVPGYPLMRTSLPGLHQGEWLTELIDVALASPGIAQLGPIAYGHDFGSRMRLKQQCHGCERELPDIDSYPEKDKVLAVLNIKLPALDAEPMGRRDWRLNDLTQWWLFLPEKDVPDTQLVFKQTADGDETQ